MTYRKHIYREQLILSPQVYPGLQGLHCVNAFSSGIALHFPKLRFEIRITCVPFNLGLGTHIRPFSLKGTFKVVLCLIGASLLPEASCSHRHPGLWF